MSGQFTQTSDVSYSLISYYSFDAGGDIGVVWGGAATTSDPSLRSPVPAVAPQRNHVGSKLQGSFQALCAPATTVRLKQSVGTLSVAAIIRAAIRHEI